MNRRTTRQHTAHGTIYNLTYQLHIEHLTALLAQHAGPEKMSEALRRVDVAVAAGKASRVQALAREINKAMA